MRLSVRIRERQHKVQKMAKAKLGNEKLGAGQSMSSGGLGEAGNTSKKGKKNEKNF